MTTFYTEARKWISMCPDTSGGVALAKLVLSLYNDQCGFAASECLQPLDTNLTKVALGLIRDYADHGETEPLRQLGRQLVDEYPGLWQQGLAMQSARQVLRDQWRREQEAEERRLYPNG